MPDIENLPLRCRRRIIVRAARIKISPACASIVRARLHFSMTGSARPTQGSRSLSKPGPVSNRVPVPVLFSDVGRPPKHAPAASQPTPFPTYDYAHSSQD